FPINFFQNFQSGDSGASWSSISTADAPSAFVFDPHSLNTAYALGVSGPKISTDGGLTFAPLAWSLTSIAQLVISPTTPGQFFALAPGGVYASSDSGATWIPLGTGLPQDVNQLTVDSTGRYLHAGISGGPVYDYQLNESLTLNPPHPFTVILSATDQRTGRVGTGVATQANDLWGWFSIPAITGNSNNPEVFVKMLDGTALNGAYWFFYG